jgi:oxygen-independent coproporphyrinogen-3 oxidase
MMARDDMPPWLWPRAAYVHIPFCAHRCGYCDFAVAAHQDHLVELYLEAIAQELSRLERATPVQTIFVGGGTPTYLSPCSLARFLDTVNRWLPLKGDGEFSIEATPESITAEKIEILADHGVNRVSLGVQTFDEVLLARLDRIHRPEHIGPAVDHIRRRIGNISVDLIFAIPNQSLDDWERDLETALRFQPAHISTYGLTYEKGTPLWKRRDRGELRCVTEDDELNMYIRAMHLLPAAGFEQYEISNFAKPGQHCRHNETYWANEAYFGFGVGAARYIMGCRQLNRRNTADYIRCVLSGEDPTFQSEKLSPLDSARETAAIQLRRTRGVERDSFRVQTGFDYDELMGDRTAAYAVEGLLEDSGLAIRLTPRGRCVADSLVTRLVWG